MTTTNRTRRRWTFLIVGIATAAAAIAAVAGYSASQSGPVDLRGHHVRADVEPSLAPPAAKVAASPDTGGRFIVKSVGLDVPLGALNAVDGVVEPPGFTSAYAIRNEGVPVTSPSKGTVFVVMHSLRNGGVGPGNFLIDVKDQKAKVADGALIQVDGVSYRVSGTAAITKTTLPQTAAVWANTPNRLVVITCPQRPQGGPSIDNMVIQATRT